MSLPFGRRRPPALSPADSLARAASLLRRGGTAMLILAVLALSLVIYTSYQARVHILRVGAIDRLTPAQETLDYDGALIDTLLKRLGTWTYETPRLDLGPKLAEQDGYTLYSLTATDAEQQSMASIWLRPDGWAEQKHAASLLNLAYRKVPVMDWVGALYMIDRQGRLVAGYPSIGDVHILRRALDLNRRLGPLPVGQTDWVTMREDDGGLCDCLAAYTVINLPEERGQALVVQTMPNTRIERLFSGPGWFGLYDGKSMVASSEGAEPALWAGHFSTQSSGLTEVSRTRGKILLKHRLGYMPWTLVYSPSRKGEAGVEWRELVPHVFVWFACVLGLFWFYYTLNRLMLKPTEEALAAVEHYQQELREKNQSLHEAKELAEQASQARSLFLAVMSHEIRTPLNGVMAMLELLDREPLTPSQRESLDLIKTSSSLLLHVISDILVFTRLQSGKVEFIAEPVAIVELVQSLVEAQRARLQVDGKSVDCRLESELDTDLRLLLDPFRVRQMLGNLMSNAVKFTDNGEVVVRLDYWKGMLVVEVGDSGIGMTSEQISRLFQPFSQADVSTVRQYGGSGLGLAIIKQLLDQSGGRIEVESEPGKGSRFRVYIPCEPAEEPPTGRPDKDPARPGARAAAPIRPGDVWVVEDHPINQATLRAQLQALGVEAHFAASGREALEQLAQAAEVALVLTDISMPEMDGFELAARLRELPHMVGVPIVALSAHAFASDIEKSRSVGMAGYLTKPVSLDALRETFSRFGVPLRETAPAVAAEPATRPVETRLDISGLMTMFDGSLSSVRALIERYLDCDAEDLRRLLDTWRDRDFPALAQIAHRMGSAGLYVDPAYADLLYEVEERATAADEAELAALMATVERSSVELAGQCRAWLDETA
jgi:signal transduction histidine kinase/CheY-like chemotaxis protein